MSKKLRVMHAARISKSPRLRRVHDVLKDGKEHSTLAILQEARVCAVNSIIAELRHNGARIDCKTLGSGEARVFLYRMRSPVIGQIEMNLGVTA